MNLYGDVNIDNILEFIIREKKYSESYIIEKLSEYILYIIRSRFPFIKKISIICGKGYITKYVFKLALYVVQQGFEVSFCYLYKLEVAKYFTQLLEAGCSLVDIRKSNDFYNFLDKENLLLEAISGVEFNIFSEDCFVIEFIKKLNDMHKIVLSLDCPSGLNIATGFVETQCVKSFLTLSLLYGKAGFFTGDGLDFSGEVVNINIFSIDSYLNSQQLIARIIDRKDLFIKKRKKNSHKKNYGHLLVVGGDYGFSGAVRMVAEAAFRIGAGMVTVATRKDHYGFINCNYPEIIVEDISDQNKLEYLLDDVDAVIVGPGFVDNKWSEKIIRKIFTVNIPKVIDAGALRVLSRIKDSVRIGADSVLTPHPGEAAFILGMTSEDIQKDRFCASQLIAKKWMAVVVLKGAGTIVKQNDSTPVICRNDNSGMSVAGMGDILSGIIGGLIAQGVSSFKASVLGVKIHTEAANLCAFEDGRIGLIASDIYTSLRKIIDEYEKNE